MISILLIISLFSDAIDVEQLHHYKNRDFCIFPGSEKQLISYVERYNSVLSIFHRKEISNLVNQLSYKLKPDWYGKQHSDLLEEGINFCLRDNSQGIREKFLKEFIHPNKIKNVDEFLDLLNKEPLLQARVTKKIAKVYSRPGIRSNVIVNIYTQQALFVLNKYYYFFDFNKTESKLKVSKNDHYEDDAILTFSTNEALDAMAMIVFNEDLHHLYLKISFRPSVQLEPLKYKNYIDCLWLTNDDLLLITFDFHTHIFNRQKRIIKDLVPLHIKLLINNNVHNKSIETLNLFDEKEIMETSYIFKIAEFANPVVYEESEDVGLNLFE